MYNEEKIIFSSLEGKPSFETVIDAIVYELFSDKNLNEIKNFIKKNCGSMINSNSDLINGNNYYSEMRGTKSFLDFTMCKDGGKNIRIYQQIQTYPKSLGVEIPYKKYLYNSDSYFASGGIIKNSFDNSNSDNNIFFDKVILHKIHKNNRENIIDLNFITGKLGLDIEHIGRKIKTENYEIQKFEDFYTDIVQKASDIPEYIAKVFWELYKNCNIKK